MAAAIRALYVDDEPGLLEIGKLFLEMGGAFVVDTLTSARVALEQLETEQYDAIISDYQMPEMDGIQFLVEVRRRFGQIPFILFTGRGREEVVIQAINSGGDFYIQKGGEPRAQFAELAHKIRQATSRKKAVDSLRRSEDEYRYLIKHSDESIVVVQDEMLRLVNQRTVERTGYSEQELLSMPFPALIHPEDRTLVVERYQMRMKGEETPSQYTFRLTGKDGSTIWVEISAVPIAWEGRPATINFLIDITGRKLAVEALKESEEKYRVIFNNEIYAISIFDPESLKLLDVNDAYAEMYGYTRKELVSGMTVRDIAADHDAFFPATEEVINRGTIFIPLRYHRKKDGTIFPVEIAGGPHLWNGKKVIFSLIHDITARKQAEEELRLTQSRLDSAMEAGKIAWWEMNCVTGDVIFNERKARMLGYPAEQFSHYTDFTRLIHPDDYESVMQAMRDHLSGIKKQYDVDYRIRSWNGAYLWTRDIGGISEYAPDGKPLKVTGVLIDITRSRLAEEALRMSEARLHTLVQTIPDLIWLKDKDGIYLSCNPMFERFFGAREAEIVGKTDYDFVDSKLADSFREHDQKAMAAGRSTRNEEWITFADNGHRALVETSKTPMYDSQGALIGVLGIGHDISKRKRAESYRQLSADILGILNEPGELSEVVRRVLDIIKLATNADAIGIRLKAAADFPYFVQNGFSRDFLLKENTLAARDRNGEICRDSEGNVSLQCMCGLVISGKKDPKNQLFTPGGSFWTNNSFPILNLPETDDPRLHPRNTCMYEGYASLALIPIRKGQLQIIGILQINAFRKDCFTLDIIQSLEQIAGHIGEALMRRQAEEALRTSEVLLQTLVNTIPDMIWLKDTEGVYLSCNPKFGRFFGSNEADIVGKTDYDFVGRKLADSCREHDQKAMVAGRSTSNEDWITSANDGHCALMETIKTPMYNAQGMVIGVLSIGRDISERKQAEDAIALANKKLNLMNNITRHDILNTITGLIGCVDMANATGSGEERRQLLVNIKNLTKTIQGQITFTKEYQAVGVNLPVWQNLGDVLQRVLVNFEKSGLQFVIDLENVEIYADPLLEKVFYNLVDNAIRYGEELTTIKFYQIHSDDGLSLICEDDGVGIPDDLKNCIFERSVGKNTGMGLFLSGEILGITKIDLRENGIPGKGARFEIVIPCGIFRFIS